VSIETDAVDTDIWTPIAMEIGVPVETTVGEVDPHAPPD
jgi:hypothetical protein